MGGGRRGGVGGPKTSREHPYPSRKAKKKNIIIIIIRNCLRANTNTLGILYRTRCDRRQRDGLRSLEARSKSCTALLTQFGGFMFMGYSTASKFSLFFLCLFKEMKLDLTLNPQKISTLLSGVHMQQEDRFYHSRYVSTGV